MFKKLSLVFMVLALGACASAPQNQQASAVQEKPKNVQPVNSTKGYSTFAVVVTGSGSDIDAGDLATVRTNFVEALSTKLVAETNLRQADPDKADLKVTLDVKQLHYVSAAKRVMLGILAGHAVLGADVTVTDQKANAALWNTNVDTTSKTSSGIFGASSTSQVEGLSQVVDDGIKSSF